MYNDENKDFISLDKKEELIPLEVHNHEEHKHYVGCNCCDTKTKDMTKIWLCVSAVLTLILLVAAVCSVGGKKESVEILKSDLAGDRTVVTTVNGDGKVYTSSEIYANNINSVVAIQTEVVTTNIFGQKISGATAGSGFIISENGYVLTNAHVVEGASSIKVLMSDKSEYKATIVGSEEESDVAVLKIESENKFKPVILGDSDKMIIGEDIVAIGNPLGELTFSITKGIVSALDRSIQVDAYTTLNMFQVDCAVNEGNSGGPIFNMYGEVIGIVSAKYASSTIEGLGFCIPINDVSNIITDLIDYGKVRNKAYMGISITDVDERMVSQYKMVKGAYISTIEKGSCAEKAGLKIGDIIVKFDDKEVKSVSELLSFKKSYRAGDSAILKIWRSGEYKDITIVFDEYDEKVVKELEEKQNEELQQQLPQGNQGYQEYPDNYNRDELEDFFWEFFADEFGY